MITGTITYCCLTCTSEHGEPAPKNTENWYWKPLGEKRRLGPFCSQACADRFHYDGATPRFTLDEVRQLEFVAHRAYRGVEPCQ